MSRNARALAWVGWLLGVLVLWGCGPGEEEQASAAREAEWSSLQEAQAALQEVRTQLRELKATIAAGPEALGATEEGMSPEEAHLKLQEEADALEDEVTTLADAFIERLVNFINADPMVQGEEPTEIQLAAIRMKSTEDVELAREYIDKGGDYRRAVDILERADGIDPGNEAVLAALEDAKEMRFVTEERFASVKKGMGEREVRELLGQVFHRNIREYEERGAVGWFYPKEDGGAVAVFFRKNRRSDEWEVYEKDFDAVEAPGQDS